MSAVFTPSTFPINATVSLLQLQTLGDWSGVRREVDLASRNVRQLGSLLFEMEVLRSYLEPHELPYFDARVIPAKTAALVAIHGLQGEKNDAHQSTKEAHVTLFT